MVVFASVACLCTGQLLADGLNGARSTRISALSGMTVLLCIEPPWQPHEMPATWPVTLECDGVDQVGASLNEPSRSGHTGAILAAGPRHPRRQFVCGLYRLRTSYLSPSMRDALRKTLQTQFVLRALLSDLGGGHCGMELCARRAWPRAPYPILARLELAGWAETRWEDPATHVAEGRPRRRYYQLTGQGVVQAREALEQAERARARLRAGALRDAPGMS